MRINAKKLQTPITDEAAIMFSREFYGALTAGLSVDAAVCEARKAIFTQVNAVEWATPVLYMRSRDGQIFDLRTTKEESPPPPPPPPPPPDTDELERVGRLRGRSTSGNRAEMAERPGATEPVRPAGRSPPRSSGSADPRPQRYRLLLDNADGKTECA